MFRAGSCRFMSGYMGSSCGPCRFVSVRVGLYGLIFWSVSVRVGSRRAIWAYLGFGAMDVTKPYKFIWFGDFHGPILFKFMPTVS